MSNLLAIPDRSTPRGRVAAGVRAQLAIANVSAAKAAKIIGLSPAAMSRRTTGSHPFDIDELGALADLLGVDVSTFLHGPGGLPDPTGAALKGQPKD